VEIRTTIHQMQASENPNAKEVLRLAKLARVMVRSLKREQRNFSNELPFFPAGDFEGRPSLADMEAALKKIWDDAQPLVEKHSAVRVATYAKCALEKVQDLRKAKEQMGSSLLFAEDDRGSQGTPSLLQMEEALSEIVGKAAEKQVVPRAPYTRADWRMKC
jgi:hypothetical protein